MTSVNDERGTLKKHNSIRTAKDYCSTDKNVLQQEIVMHVFTKNEKKKDITAVFMICEKSLK